MEEENKLSNEYEREDLNKKIKELDNLKMEIGKQIEIMEKSGNEHSKEKIEKFKKMYNTINESPEKLDEDNIDDTIIKLNTANKRLNLYQRFMNAFEQDMDIDPGRLMGLTDGIFGMVMTLLIFGMALPEFQISNYSGFIDFIHSSAPTIGLTLVSFILLASFWIYHHEFIKIKTLNMPYLWFNIFFLAAISFIPFTTSIVGNYSHFFLANVIFGANIFITILLFLLMFHYAYKKDFLEEKVSKEEKKYIHQTLYIIMAVTIIVNLLDFNVSHNFIYLFFLIPIISTIRDISYKIKHN